MNGTGSTGRRSSYKLSGGTLNIYGRERVSSLGGRSFVDCAAEHRIFPVI